MAMRVETGSHALLYFCFYVLRRGKEKKKVTKANLYVASAGCPRVRLPPRAKDPGWLAQASTQVPNWQTGHSLHAYLRLQGVRCSAV